MQPSAQGSPLLSPLLWTHLQHAGREALLQFEAHHAAGRGRGRQAKLAAGLHSTALKLAPGFHVEAALVPLCWSRAGLLRDGQLHSISALRVLTMIIHSVAVSCWQVPAATPGSTGQANLAYQPHTPGQRC